MVHKGSVAVEGISLTIADFDGETITIAILPLTYWRTNLHTLAPGAPVNVEADVLVKLAHAQMRPRKSRRWNSPRPGWWRAGIDARTTWPRNSAGRLADLPCFLLCFDQSD